MKKLILSLLISVIFALSACSSPADETVTVLTDHALISSQETREKESTTERRSECSSPPEETFTEPGFPEGIRAGYMPETEGYAEPSGEEYVQNSEDVRPSGGGYYPSPATQQTTARQDMETQKTESQSTACRHGSVYVSGAYSATCISQGYSGDTYCALCGALLECGYMTGYADHTWVGETMHEDAYLTCYCGLTFTSADDHDRHVNEMVNAGESAADHGCIWTPGRDYTVYTCSVCGEKLNN